MVSLRTIASLGIIAALAFGVIYFRRPLFETGAFLGAGISSLGTGAGMGLTGLAGGLRSIIGEPAKGFSDALAAITSQIRNVAPEKTLAEGGIPFTGDLPFGGIEFGPGGGGGADDRVITPNNRELSDVRTPFEKIRFPTFEETRRGIFPMIPKGRRPSPAPLPPTTRSFESRGGREAIIAAAQRREIARTIRYPGAIYSAVGRDPRSITSRYSRRPIGSGARFRV